MFTLSSAPSSFSVTDVEYEAPSYHNALGQLQTVWLPNCTFAGQAIRDIDILKISASLIEENRTLHTEVQKLTQRVKALENAGKAAVAASKASATETTYDIMNKAAKLKTTTAYSLMQACQDGSMSTVTKAARVDYGMDFHAKAEVEDIFKCYQNVLTHAKLSCEDLHQAFLDDALNEKVLARCTDTGLRTKIETAGGIYNSYMYLKDKEAGKPVDDSIEKKKEDYVMKCIRNSGNHLK